MHTSSHHDRPGRAGAWVLLLAFVFVVGCDTGGSSDPPDPPPDDTSSVSTAVRIPSDTLNLPGTLLTPDTSAAVPGVVIVHGSGPVDRNGQSPATSTPPVYKRWAERMAERGLAVLRYDKRTTLPALAEADPRTVTFPDFVRDAVAAGRLLRNREAVDEDSIVFVGHSQGGNVAPAAATRLDGTVGAAALASPALAIDSLVVAQLGAQGGRPGCTADRARAQFDSLRAGQSVSNGLICGAGLAFWRQWIRHSEHIDSVAAALTPPLFAQQGRADPNYPGETLQRSLDGWRRIARTDSARLATYEDVDHFFLTEGTDETADAPLDDLIGWIRRR
jgi:alpha-beta hydrolase superfamily lysophospholipase